ncbi:MAG: YraN family protein [Treponema sp.]|jgi:putative endonuclease|nr:YraN family protein [Treponema sp.]
MADTRTTSKGREGENRAAAAMEDAGMRIIARNFRGPGGEIDLIVQDGDTVVFIEVKSWAHYGFEDLQYAIDLKKQRRIIETAKYFIASNRKYKEMAFRFDALFVEPEKVTHLASAFMECV